MTQNTLTASRRSVVRAAAWTVPAVSLAVAAPAFAASDVKTGTASGTLTRASLTVTPSVTFTNSGVTGYDLHLVVTYHNGSQTFFKAGVAAGQVVTDFPGVFQLGSNNTQTITFTYYHTQSGVVTNRLGTLTFANVPKDTTTPVVGVWTPN